ncbi:MAG: hypothetical protein IKU02_00890 [Bacteroidaceae bacterium]|nr:hypothetical protein [Bacteroidaceae bacterium]
MLLALTMNQPAHAGDFLSWLSDFFNEYYNEREYGPQCYSEVNAKTGIGEGKVYVEWARQNTSYSAEYVSPKLKTEISVQSPSDLTSRAGYGNTTTNHKYVFCASPEEGWEFEGVYTDEDCQYEYSPTDSQIQDGIYAGKVEVATNSSTSSTNHPVLNLYARFSLSVTIGSRLYSTLYYSNYNFKVPTGVTATTYKLGNGSGKLDVSTTYSAGQIIPAGEAVVLNGAAGTYEFVPVSGTYAKDNKNILQGFDEATTTTGGDKYYALQWSNEKGKVGFFWVNNNGAAFTSPAHKAYLALSGTSGVKGFTFEEEDPTGINEVESNFNDDEVIYNIAGQRINKMQKGINIINGKKILK